MSFAIEYDYTVYSTKGGSVASIITKNNVGTASARVEPIKY